MDLRELKKECRRAVDILVRDHAYSRDAFTPSDGTETLYAPTDLDARFSRHGFIEPGVHKGTLVHWYRSSYEYNEWDCELPSDLLRQIEFWSTFDPADLNLNPAPSDASEGT